MKVVKIDNNNNNNNNHVLAHAEAFISTERTPEQVRGERSYQSTAAKSLRFAPSKESPRSHSQLQFRPEFLRPVAVTPRTIAVGPDSAVQKLSTTRERVCRTDLSASMPASSRPSVRRRRLAPPTALSLALSLSRERESEPLGL